MKSFLNSFMNDFRNIGDSTTNKFEDAFKKASALSFSVFGKNAFRKYRIGTDRDPNGGWESQINRPLFDVIMWGFTRFEKNDVIRHSDEIRAALIELLTSNARFVDAITAAVGDKGKTKYRFETWLSALNDTISTSHPKRVFSSEFKASLFAQENRCGICGQAIHSLDDCHVDHIVPHSKGGRTEPENAQLAHRFCNLNKSDL